jgi:amidohydrolase
MTLISERILSEASALRRQLHAFPELSGREAETAERISRALAPFRPDQVHSGVGGHGVLAVFDSGKPGLTLGFRAELDALPIEEANHFSYRSTRQGISHKCGHDGHMATLIALAALIRERGLNRGKVVLLFQPAEESGEGARAMLKDPRLAALELDHFFAFHNLPKHPLHQVIVRRGVFASASVGMEIRLSGSTTHSSYPEDGRSPALALAELVGLLHDLAGRPVDGEELRLTTITQMKLGYPEHKIDFGVAPADGLAVVVLRAASQEVLNDLKEKAVQLSVDIAKRHQLEIAIRWDEEFASTWNQPEAVEWIRDAALVCGLRVKDAEVPFRWSEDFGLFLQNYPGALFGLGAGESHPQLHNESYDFPDELIPTGASIFWALIERMSTSDECLH